MSSDAPIVGDRLLGSLSEAQLSAVTSDADFTYVAACPGSGKTRVLAARAVWLLRLRGVAASQIACFTFTREAAEELRGRIAESVGQEVARQVWCGTFHAYAYRFVSWLFRVRVADEAEEESVIRSLVTGSERDPAISKRGITALRDTMMRASAGMDLSISGIRDMSIVESRFDARQLVWRGSLLRMFRMLAHGGRVDADVSPSLVRHVLLDEAQDMTKEEVRFVRLFNTAKVTAVADPNQSIFRWRHAGPEHVQSLARGSVSILQLGESYRLPFGISSLADKYAVTGSKITPRPGETNYLVVGDSVGAMARVAAEQYGHKNVVVLCRTNAECAMVSEHAGWLVNAVHVQREWPDRTLRYARNLARLIIDPDDDAALLALMDEDEIPASRAAEWGARNGPSMLLKISTGEYPPRDWAAGEHASMRRQSFRSSMALAMARCGLVECEISEWAQRIGLDPAVLDMSLEDALSVLAERTEESGFDAVARDGKTVAVATVHAAKGREWDCVILYRMPTLEPDLEREVAYVAMTRARKELVCDATLGEFRRNG